MKNDIKTIDPYLLFYYELKDAYGFLIWNIYIYDYDKDNINIINTENNTETNITISNEDINEIKNILNDNIYLINIKDPIFNPSILDGTQEEIYINIEGLVNKISCCNLWAFKDDKEKTKDVEACFKIINEINNILKKYKLKIIMNEE